MYAIDILLSTRVIHTALLSINGTKRDSSM